MIRTYFRIAFMSLLILLMGCGNDDDSQSTVTLEISTITPEEIFTNQQITIVARQTGVVPELDDIEISFDDTVFTAVSTEIDSEGTSSIITIKVNAPANPSEEVILKLVSGSLSDTRTIEVKEPSVDTITIDGINPNNGPVGTEVVITGSGFKDGDRVFFSDTREAVISSLTETSITVEVPMGAVTGIVAVNRSGTTFAEGPTFTVTGSSGLSIANITPASAPVGATVVIEGQFSDPAQVEVLFGGFGASIEAMIISRSSTRIEVTVPERAIEGISISNNTDFVSDDFTVIGSPDFDFLEPSATRGFTTGGVFSSIKDSQGRILTGGTAMGNSSQGLVSSPIQRLNADGTFDNSFSYNGNSGVENQQVVSMMALDNNKILISGRLNLDDNNEQNLMIRLNEDGSIDDSFNFPVKRNATFADAFANTILKDAQNRIFLLGRLPNGSNLVRITNDGDIDAAFTSPIFNGAVTSAIIYQDMIYVVGGFTMVNGQTRNGIAAFNLDGALQSIFEGIQGFAGGTATRMINIDNTIYIGGLFESFNGVTATHIMAIDSNGTMNTSFSSSLEVGDTVSDITAIDNRIMVSTASNNLILIDETGAIDTGFNSGSNANNGISTLCLINDERLFIGGLFTEYFGYTQNGYSLIRLP